MCIPTSGTYSDPVSCPPMQACVGTGCIPTVCQPNQRFCKDGLHVAQCGPLGDSSSDVQTCDPPEACMNGGCVNACAGADLMKSFAGCQFYAVDMDNYGNDDSLENDIMVANTSAFTATVKVEVRQGTNWTQLCTAQVAPQDTHAFALTSTCDFNSTTYLDRHVEDSALVPGLAYRISSDAPVVAYYFNSDDKSGAAASSGSMVLLPKATLGKKYYALSWPQPDSSFGFNADINRASMDVVATETATTVTVTASTHIIAGSGVPAMNPGDTHTFTLDEGDALQLETMSQGDDLSGTLVVSDKPVAVYAGVECAVNPNGGTDCDHTEEQMLPLSAWGKNYVAPRIAGQSENCAGSPPEVGCPQSAWRVLGSVANTTVTIMAPPGVTVTPGGPFTLGPGQVQEFTATNPSQSAPGDFFIAADQPIFVMQLTGSEAAMVTAVPVEQYLPSYLFEAPDFFCSTLDVIRKAGTTVKLDNNAIADSLFTPAGNGYEVARLPLDTDMSACGVGRSQGNVTQHTITTVAGPDGRIYPPGISVYGVDVNCSYGYVGGLSVQVINDIP
jgi:hypothetical protein